LKPFVGRIFLGRSIEGSEKFNFSKKKSDFEKLRFCCAEIFAGTK